MYQHQAELALYTDVYAYCLYLLLKPIYRCLIQMSMDGFEVY